MADPSVISQWLNHARRLVAAGRWDEALDAYMKVSEHDQHNLEVRGEIIELCQRTGNFQEVILQHIDCAEILTLQQLRTQAIEHYEQILRLEETVRQSGGDVISAVRMLVAQYKPEIYFQIGEYQLANGKADLALQYLRKSHELAQGRWQTHLALARCYQAKKLDKEAIGEYQEVLRLAPEESAPAYEGLGEIFVAQGRPVPTTVVWFQHAAEYYRQRNQLEDMRRVLERIQALQPGETESARSTPTSSFASMDDWVSGR